MLTSAGAIGPRFQSRCPRVTDGDCETLLCKMFLVSSKACASNRLFQEWRFNSQSKQLEDLAGTRKRYVMSLTKINFHEIRSSAQFNPSQRRML